MILELSNSVTPPAELGIICSVIAQTCLPSRKASLHFPGILVSTVYSGIFIQVAGHKSQISGINLGSIWDIRLMPCCLDLTLSVPVFNVSQRRSVGDWEWSVIIKKK
jgi:hypothetical protein